MWPVEIRKRGRLAATVLCLGLVAGSAPATAAASSSAAATSTAAAAAPGRSPTARTAPLTQSTNLSFATVLGFEDLPLETEVTTQYEPEGVLFSGADASTPPVITEDEDSPFSPVLAGSPLFEGTINAQFVIPGTATPTSVTGLSLEIGYIDEPGSTRVVIHTPTGGEVLTADEYGIDYLSTSTAGITGFSAEITGDEPAGFALDDASFTPGTTPLFGPPPPAPVAPSNPCGHVKAWFGIRVLRALECKYARTQNGVACAAGIGLLFGPLKVAKGAKAADGFYQVHKVQPSLRPLATLYNDLYKATRNPSARNGFQSFGQLLNTLKKAKLAIDVVKVLPDLAQALSHQDINEIALDMANVLGLEPCVKGLANVMR